MKRKNIAIISPNQNAYSETFIQAHRKLDGNIFYYYDGLFPNKLEDYDDLQITKWRYFKYLFFRRIGIVKENGIKYYLFKRSLKRNKIDVLLAEYGPSGVEVLGICKSLSIPLIVHFHGYDASEGFTLTKYSEGYKKLFNYASFVVAVSQHMKSKLLELGCPPEKLRLNICGVNPYFFQIVPSFESFQFIGVGRFVEKKGPHLTILAFNELLKKGYDVKLVLVGDGPLLGSCIALSKSLKILDKIDFMGVLDFEAIGMLFSQSLCFVQHSVTALNGDSEGTPVAAIEAMAASLPIITTKHAGLIDLVTEGETGYLVDELDIAGMAKKIEDLVKDPNKARTLGEAGRRYALENHSLQQSLDVINDLINQAVV